MYHMNKKLSEISGFRTKRVQDKFSITLDCLVTDMLSYFYKCQSYYEILI